MTSCIVLKYDSHKNIHINQNNVKRFLFTSLIRPLISSMTDHIPEHKRHLQDQEIPHDEVNMLQPTLHVLFVHFVPTFRYHLLLHSQCLFTDQCRRRYDTLSSWTHSDERLSFLIVTFRIRNIPLAQLSQRKPISKFTASAICRFSVRVAEYRYIPSDGASVSRIS